MVTRLRHLHRTRMQKKAFDNCKAEIGFAENAMKLSEVKDYHIIKGWFKDSLINFPKNEKIAILRLDGDWYESTMTTLDMLFDSVS